MDSYITREELRLEPYAIPKEVDEKYLEVLQELTKEIVNSLCGQSFEPEGTVSVPVEYRADGTGKETVFMPIGKRLVSLSEVRIYTAFNAADTYTPDNFQVEKRFLTWNSYGDISVRLGGGMFDKGLANIGIVGVWGYAETPKGILYLQGKFIKKIIEDEEFAERFNSEKIGDYSSTLALRGDKEFAITGDKELDIIIRQYRNNLFYATV